MTKAERLAQGIEETLRQGKIRTGKSGAECVQNKCLRCAGSGMYGTYGVCYGCGGVGGQWVEIKAEALKRAKREIAAGYRENKRKREDADREDAFRAALHMDPELANALDTDHHIVNDIGAKLKRFGSISDKQRTACLNIARSAAERVVRKAAEEAAKVDMPDLHEGRQAIEGVVLTTKWQGGQWGEVEKMLVQLDSGHKVWGSVPSSIEVEKGDRVEFVATVERSKDDHTFGFFKRPTRAAILNGDKVEA